jgi:hypothetical protein
MADANEQTTTETAAVATDAKEDYIPRSEAQLAFKARDKAKEELAKIKARALSDEDLAEYQSLKAMQVKAEEDKAKKAGEFESLKQQLTKKHQDEIAERESRMTSLSQRFKDTVIKAEFGSASEYFNGSDASKTILDVELGMAAFSKYVHVEDADDDPRGYRVIVKTPRGETIVGTDGNPAPFSEAIGELISLLPNKDRILRGGGKTGSGSSGGSNHPANPADVTELTLRAQRGDKDAIAALRNRRNAGNGLVMGSAFTR